MDRARVVIDAWPTPCAYCGCRFGWRLVLGDDGIRLGCVRTNPVAEVVRIARHELRRSA